MVIGWKCKWREGIELLGQAKLIIFEEEVQPVAIKDPKKTSVKMLDVTTLWT